jgi:hypothetical protein
MTAPTYLLALACALNAAGIVANWWPLTGLGIVVTGAGVAWAWRAATGPVPRHWEEQ